MSGDASSSITLGPDDPWPGLNQFLETHEQYFHGRDEEKAELFRLVKCETLTTLFGRSGLGKSSLLYAGLFPLLRQNGYLPVLIHIRHDEVSAEGAEPAPPLVVQVYAALSEACAAANVEAPEIRAGESLWEYFHRAGASFWNERDRLVTPVLVFDQFEEAFTLGAETSERHARRHALFTELEQLIENRPPKAIRERWDRDPDLVSRFEQDRTPCKIVLSLREDFLPDLEELKDRIRSIMGNRFRLERMDGSKAWQVVMGDAAGKPNTAHLVDEDVALKIIDFVSRTRARRDEEPLTREGLRGRTVDPALLSVVCSELNRRRRERGEHEISFTLVSESKEEIIREFFDTHVNGLGAGSAATRRFIEEELITEGEGYRKRCALEEEMLRRRNVRKEDMRILERQRILRFEPSEGITWIELTHDLLTGVVRESRRERRTREEREAAERKAHDERVRLEGEHRERRKQKRRWGLMAAVVIAAVAALGVAWIFNDQARSGDWYRLLIATDRVQSALAETPPDLARATLMAARAAEYHPPGLNRITGYPYEIAVAMLGELPVFIPAITVECKKAIKQVTYSPDGNHLGLIFDDGSFCVRKETDDLAFPEADPTEPEAKRETGINEKVAGFAFLPYGRPVVALRLRDKEAVKLYNYEEGSSLAELTLPETAASPEPEAKDEEDARGIAFSPDGSLLAVAAGDARVLIYSVADLTGTSGANVKPVAWTGLKSAVDKVDAPPPTKPASSVVFIWAGRFPQVVASNPDGVWVWPDERDQGNGKLQGELKYERMVTRGRGRDAEDSQSRYLGNSYWLPSPEGKQSVGIIPYRDATEGFFYRDDKVWAALLGNENIGESAPLALPGQITAAACAPDGELLAIGASRKGIYLYRHRDLIQRLDLGGDIGALSFRPDGKVLAAVIKTSEHPSRLAFLRLTKHGEAAAQQRAVIAEKIAISSNGLRLATLEDGKVRLVDAVSGDVLKEKTAGDAGVNQLTVSDTGQVLAFAADNVWDVFASDTRRTLKLGPGFGISGDGAWVVRPRGDDSGFEVMRVSTGESKAVGLPARRSSLYALSHDGRVVARYNPPVGNATVGTIELCSNPWLPPARFKNKKGDDGLVESISCAAALTALAFSGDNRLLFAASESAEGSSLLVFDLVLGKQKLIRRGLSPVNSMAVSKELPRLALALESQPVGLWGEGGDLNEMRYLANADVDQEVLGWRDLDESEILKLRDSSLKPVDRQAVAFWDAFWKVGRNVAQLREEASLADLEEAYEPLRSVLSGESGPDDPWQKRAMRKRLNFWKSLTLQPAASGEELAALRAALPSFEANEQRIVERVLESVKKSGVKRPSHETADTTDENDSDEILTPDK